MVRDVEADERRNAMAMANTGLAADRVFKARTGSRHEEDYLQEAFIGLLKACARYSPEKRGKLSTYAYYWIDQAIRRAYDIHYIAHIPEHVYSNAGKIRKEMTRIHRKTDVEPGFVATGVAMGYTKDQAEMAYTAYKMRDQSAGGSMTIDLVGIHQETEDVEESKEAIRAAVDKLPADLQAVYEVLYVQGLSGTPAAKAMGVSRERARQRRNQLHSAIRGIIETGSYTPETSGEEMFARKRENLELVAAMVPAFRTVNRVADVCGVSRSTASNYLCELREAGRI